MKKLSGVVFCDQAREMSWKRPLGRRSVLRASAAVRATDVMVNQGCLQV